MIYLAQINTCMTLTEKRERAKSRKQTCSSWVGVRFVDRLEFDFRVGKVHFRRFHMQKAIYPEKSNHQKR